MRGYYTVIIALTLVTFGVSASQIPSLYMREPDCPSKGNVRLPYQELCTTLYYICQDGKFVINECPEGLHFNNELKICDFPLDECYPDKPMPQVDNSDIYSE